MGSVAFPGEDDYQPSSFNGDKYNLPQKLLDGCAVVSHASVPKKLRSVIKKRWNESITFPLPILKKKHLVLNGVDAFRKDGTKKSKLNKRKGHISKDEKEVAETLYALAGMFKDAIKGDQPGMDHEQQETKSAATLEEGGSMSTAEGEESRNISSKVMIDKPCLSLVDSSTEIVKSQSLGVQKRKLLSSMELSTPSVQLKSRPPASILDMALTSEGGIDLKQDDGVSGVQCFQDYYPMDDKYMVQPPDLPTTQSPSSETQKSCPRFFDWFTSTNLSSQPCATENNITTVKNSWKRSTTHVYLSHLIKVSKESGRKEALPKKPTRFTGFDGTELQPHSSTHNQATLTKGRNGGASSSGINGSLTHKDSHEIHDIIMRSRPLQDQQMATETSALSPTYQGYDFLSLGTGHCCLDKGNSVNVASFRYDPLSQYHASYLASQDHSLKLFPSPQNGHSASFHNHSSALPTQQVQLPQYHSMAANISFTAGRGQQMEPHQQKWAAQLQAHYNTSDGIAPHSAQWKNGGRNSSSVLNYMHTLFPYLNAALGSKHQQCTPPQYQLLPPNNSSLPLLSSLKGHQHHLSLSFDRNEAAFCRDNIQL